MGLSGCAFDSTPVDDSEPSGPSDPSNPSAPGEQLGEAQDALIIPDFPICKGCLLPYLCNPAVSDDCCDPSKYSSCTVQSSGPQADVKVKLYQCKEVGPADNALITECEVEPGWTVIGGGGEIIGADATNVTIDASYPPRPDQLTPSASFKKERNISTDRKWRVSSQRISPETPQRHKLKAYALGMKLKGYDNVNHFAPIRATWSAPWLREASVKNEEEPRAWVEWRKADMLLGGGYGVFTHATYYPAPGMAMNHADAGGMINAGFGVMATGVHRDAVGSVVAIAISVDQCPDRWDGCFSAKTVRADSTSSRGRRDAFAANPGSGYIFTGLGAFSGSSYRPIESLRPIPGGTTTISGGLVTSFSEDFPGDVTAFGYFIKYE